MPDKLLHYLQRVLTSIAPVQMMSSFVADRRWRRNLSTARFLFLQDSSSSEQCQNCDVGADCDFLQPCCIELPADRQVAICANEWDNCLVPFMRWYAGILRYQSASFSTLASSRRIWCGLSMILRLSVPVKPLADIKTWHSCCAVADVHVLLLPGSRPVAC